MTNERAAAITARMAGRRALAARIVESVRFSGWDGVLAYMDSGEFGKAACMVLDAVVADRESLADMIWEG